MSKNSQSTFDQALIGIEFVVTGTSIDANEFPSLFEKMDWLIDEVQFPIVVKATGNISVLGYPEVVWVNGENIFLQYFNYKKHE